RLRCLVERARAYTSFYRDLRPPSTHREPREAIEKTLASIAPLEKEQYRENPASFLASDIPRHRLRTAKTSGTTGTPLPLWHTPETLAEEYATVWRMRRSAGVALSDPHLTFGGRIIVPFRQKTPPFWRVNSYSRQTLFSLYHMAPGNLPHYVGAIHDAPARYAEGYPSSLYLVAHALLDAGRALPAGRMAAVFTSSESLLAFHRTAIERAFGAPVRDRYGTSEFAVSMTGCEVNNLHVDSEFCAVEVEPAEDTVDYVRGPLLVTGLSNNATCFLRYRIGDTATQLKGRCPCGRPGDVFSEIDGRTDDYVVTPDGRRIGRLDHIFKGQLDVAEAQILQEHERTVTFLIVPRRSYNNASRKKLMKEIRGRLGTEIEVEIRLVDCIERGPGGKFRAVISRVGNGSKPGESSR
ncbi:unnamed protein product, partial [marine sediment metagenome]